ncbi:MAG: FG-GAP repeat domain-containing protein, partial [Steroidobacteraceae bacterium]
MLDRRGTTLRLLATGTVLAGLASCGGGNPYDYTVDVPNSIVVADFNGDGHPDIAVASAQIDQAQTNESAGYVSLMLQSSSSPGTFQTPVHFPTDGNPSAMAAGDFLGTGGVDLAVANVDRGTISVLLETSPGAASFQPAESVPTTGTPN